MNAEHTVTSGHRPNQSPYYRCSCGATLDFDTVNKGMVAEGSSLLWQQVIAHFLNNHLGTLKYQP